MDMKNIKGYTEHIMESKKGTKDLNQQLLKEVRKKQHSLQRIKEFIDVGADLEARNNDGQTPLHMATIKGYLDVAQILIQAGADLEARTDDDWGKTSLMLATYHNRPDVVMFLIQAGADLEAKDLRWKMSPLNWASDGGSLKIQKILIDAGADLETRSKDGDTPLNRAAGHSTPRYFAPLISAGADVNTKNDDGQTPLHQAAYYGRKEAFNALLKAGADINAKDKDGQTALSLAVTQKWKLIEFRGDRDMARVLIERGADPLPAFDSIEDMKEFFWGDIGWVPEDATERLKKRERGRGAFGRF